MTFDWVKGEPPKESNKKWLIEIRPEFFGGSQKDSEYIVISWNPITLYYLDWLGHVVEPFYIARHVELEV
jgi:hypothetical protein